MPITTETLTMRMEKYLSSVPNQMANEWALLGAMYPGAALGDKANGGRMGCIRRIARKSDKFLITGEGASTIVLIG